MMCTVPFACLGVVKHMEGGTQYRVTLCSPENSLHFCFPRQPKRCIGYSTFPHNCSTVTYSANKWRRTLLASNLKRLYIKEDINKTLLVHIYSVSAQIARGICFSQYSLINKCSACWHIFNSFQFARLPGASI